LRALLPIFFALLQKLWRKFCEQDVNSKAAESKGLAISQKVKYNDSILEKEDDCYEKYSRRH